MKHGVEGRMTLRGVGQVRVEPDHAVLRFRAWAVHVSAREAMARVARQAKRAIEVMMGLGIDRKDIETLQISLREETEYVKDRDKWIHVGFAAQQEFRVVLNDLDAMGELIDRFLDEVGIESILGIEFGRHDLRAASDAALRAAYAKAKARAQVLADEAGVTLLGPAHVTDQTSRAERTSAPPQLFESGYAMRESIGSTVQPRSLTIEAEVSVDFAYRWQGEPEPR